MNNFQKKIKIKIEGITFLFIYSKIVFKMKKIKKLFSVSGEDYLEDVFSFGNNRNYEKCESLQGS